MMRATTGSVLLSSLLITALAVISVPTAGALAAQQTLALAAAQGRSLSVIDETPTFYADVLPILQENCQTCHRDAGANMGGQIAPWPLITYEDARVRAPRMAKAVQEGRMPPWSAADWQRGTFKDERFLEDDEKAILIAWADGGAPAGDPAHAPPVPEFLLAAEAGVLSEWQLGEPDLILEFDEPYCLTDDIRDIYVDIPLNLTQEQLPQDRWIKSIEYRNGPAVHHIVGGVGGLVPGARPRVYDDGYGRLLEAGPRTISFNMHYNKTPGPGTAVCSNIKVGITFKEPGEVIRHVTGGSSLMIRNIMIPAGAESHAESREYVFEEDVELLRFMPHMHLRGKAALYEITYPDGRHETLLHVPNYAFNWQHSYEFEEPVFIPEGSTLRFTLWWDNSENNPANPDPSVDVKWGRPTHAEMSQGYMSFRRLEERHIVVGGDIPDDVRIADSADDNSDGN
jgi:mono/diheme cytochrome c family protein